jgi:hypothetical protein
MFAFMGGSAVGADRVAVIVSSGDRPVTSELLQELSNALIALHKLETLDTHVGDGWHGRYEYWYHCNWRMQADNPVGVAAEHRPCPRCSGTGKVKGSEDAECPVCRGQPWRSVWDFGVGYPVEWVREAVTHDQIEQHPNVVLGPDGRLYPWSSFEQVLAEYPNCWVVPVYGGP